MAEIKGTVVRTNDYGLCVFEGNDGHHYAFTANQLEGYRGEDFDELGLKKGSPITAMVEDETVKSAKMG